LGHITRKSGNETIKAVMEWKPEGKRSRGGPRKRWLDMVEGHLKEIGIKEWKRIVQDHEAWRNAVMAAKTLREL